MSDEEIGSQIRKTLNERREAVQELATINARMSYLGRHLIEIGKALESGAPQGTDDPLLWQLRDLEGDIAAVLNPDLLRQHGADYGPEGVFRTMAGKGSPTLRTGLQLATNKDYLGHEIAPKGMNPLASSARTALSAAKSLAPIPLSLTNQVDMLFGPESHKYTWVYRSRNGR